VRILHLCTDIYGGHGGIALYNREVISALASHPDVEEIVVLPRVIFHDQLETIPPKVRFDAGAAAGRVAFIRALGRARRSGPFDLVICAHVNLLPIARLVTKAPLLFVYGIEAWKPLRDRISNRLVAGARGVVAISDVTRDRFEGWSHYAGPMHILPNSIHAEAYGIRPKNEELMARLGLQGRRVLLTLGRVVAAERYKGFDEVLEVLPDVARVFDNVTYVIAGGGNDLPRLARKAAQLGVADRVVFAGFIREEEKADIYNLADVYVMPSRGEGFGFVFLEAVACGVPAIGSRLDGGQEALLGGALGRLVDSTSPAEVRIAILDALANGIRQIPDGLGYFSYANFERRLHEIVDATMRETKLLNGSGRRRITA
jgi:glycosyltransferase involved in cell wall biosynthesis